MVTIDELSINSWAGGMARKHYWVTREGMTINQLLLHDGSKNINVDILQSNMPLK